VGEDPLVRHVLDWGADWWNAPWPMACPACGVTTRIQRRLGLHRFVCEACAFPFIATASVRPLLGLPAPIWVLSAYLLTNNASVRQLQILGITHKTALVVARTVRLRIGLPVPRDRRLRSKELILITLLKRAWQERALEASEFTRDTTLLFWNIAPNERA